MTEQEPTVADVIIQARKKWPNATHLTLAFVANTKVGGMMYVTDMWRFRVGQPDKGSYSCWGKDLAAILQSVIRSPWPLPEPEDSNGY